MTTVLGEGKSEFKPAILNLKIDQVSHFSTVKGVGCIYIYILVDQSLNL